MAIPISAPAIEADQPRRAKTPAERQAAYRERKKAAASTALVPVPTTVEPAPVTLRYVTLRYVTSRPRPSRSLQHLV